jgi:hypothetical protein
VVNAIGHSTEVERNEKRRVSGIGRGKGEICREWQEDRFPLSDEADKRLKLVEVC